MWFRGFTFCLAGESNNANVWCIFDEWWLISEAVAEKEKSNSVSDMTAFMQSGRNYEYGAESSVAPDVRVATTVGETTFRDPISVRRANHNTIMLQPWIPHGEHPIIMSVDHSYGSRVKQHSHSFSFHFVSVCLDLLPPNIHLHPNHTLIDGTAIHAASASCHSSRLGVILRIHITSVIIFTKYTAKCGGFIFPLDAIF